VPRRVATRAVRSYRTFSPLPARKARLGGLFSVALSMGFRPPGVTWRPARWSPDFPPKSPLRATRRLSGRLLLSQAGHYTCLDITASSLLRKSQASARQGANDRKSAVYAPVHEYCEAVFNAVSRRLRIFEQPASRRGPLRRPNPASPRWISSGRPGRGAERAAGIPREGRQRVPARTAMRMACGP